MAKVIIYLRDHESAALNVLAQREYRAPKAQAALIIRKELERLGMIPSEQGQTMPATASTVRSETECVS
jgi:hypothetical protein